MAIPLQVTFRNVPHSAALENNIRNHAEKLLVFFSQIMACKVVIDMPQKHHHQGKLYNVRINLAVPGKELVATRYMNEDFFVALREAFDNAKRQLEELNIQKHSNGRPANNKFPMYGYVSQLFPQEGYGFIETTDGHEVYFNQCVVHPTYKQLTIGMRVQFLEELGEKGPQASRVKLKRETNGE